MKLGLNCLQVSDQDIYLKLNSFRKEFPKIPILALTATAIFRVVQEIAKHLELKDPLLVTTNFDRPNLYLKCIQVKKIGVSVMDKWLKKYRSSKIIIYTNSRKGCVALSNEINKKYGNKSSAYHAGMSKGMRYKIQNSFSSGDINIRFFVNLPLLTPITSSKM